MDRHREDQEGHRMRFMRPATALVAATMLLAGCGSQSEAEAIAAEVCGIYDQLLEGDGESLFDSELLEEFDALEQRVQDADLTDAEVEVAIRDECPGTVEELEQLFSSELDLDL
jgi:hypothetical protein